ncbi:5-demethoxyubiquinol-8 5-hydroxylase UbiM [Acetobacter sp. AN02]|uniref:5-demethoxyubiquinol-8 5-hydroxylase UbiM n=1 Tax=Acetobacter sp. AN02 TaxID=2894186 RepID=UPI0024342D13|nr:5-demethoxyubiquinol-8 5-hydroxylase UbiM [Acetobacter sp. AN02]MDG6093849.1 5-demethoxyubiquinol-8 5-hydroxylase UbiM [Acetobacter sp. AN02]
MSTELYPEERSDIVVIGGGPAGLAAAISLSDAGFRVTVLEQAPEAVWEAPSFDGREIALTHHSRTLLEAAGAWERVAPDAISLLKEARVETGRGHHPLMFHAPSSQDEPLGWLVSNHELRRALFASARERNGITLCPQSRVATVRRGQDADYVHVVSSGETRRIAARLVIGADGRFSPTRRRAGIGAIVHDFGRMMMVCRMAHDVPHDNVALQWFDEGQTIAMLPVQGQASSLVLTLPPEETSRLLNMEPEAFAADIMARTDGRFGEMRLISTRHVYPLKCVYAHRFAAPRLALIGDAAVGMHPITAHGFNLGLRGQETLTQEVSRAAERGEDIGALSVLRRFERRHRHVTMPLFAGTNGIASLYTRDGLLPGLVRRAGLRAAEMMPFFRSAVTRMLTDPEETPAAHTRAARLPR